MFLAPICAGEQFHAFLRQCDEPGVANILDTFVYEIQVDVDLSLKSGFEETHNRFYARMGDGCAKQDAEFHS